ncbi:MAG: Gfo/Idh/MocA family protein [Planctomycetota bacterium]|jgi:predicted dehydrogenase
MSNKDINRRDFLGGIGSASMGMFIAAAMTGRRADAAEKVIPGFDDKGSGDIKQKWEPVSTRKIRMGIVGYGLCKFGAAFGFQDHPNVEIVAVSDLIKERREGLMKACRCAKSYDSLEELVKDDSIEAVFIATDAPSHPKHCIDVMNHGKHVMVAVPAVWGSLEDADRLLETVQKTGMKYMMAETSCFRADCYGMMKIYKAGGFGKLVYSEGEYHHYWSGEVLPSFNNWRLTGAPLWYPTHATAYYVGVTGERFTSVSAMGRKADREPFKPGGNPFSDETALFKTSEGGTSRMMLTGSIYGLISETGRVFGEKGFMLQTKYRGLMKNLPDIRRPALPPGMPAGGHGGSHGPLTNEFLESILLDRIPLVNIYQALSMTVPGIVAHQSAMKDGENLKVPQYVMA